MRILIVEDDKQVAAFLKKSLKNECFCVDTADEGEKGLFLACTNEYDLIILDNMLPKKKGVEICQELRKRKKKVPILILSVKSEVSEKVNLLDAGADDYLVKPFSFKELVARIRALTRRNTEPGDEVIGDATLTIDTTRQIVKRGGKEIVLTRKEFMLLEFLAINRGKPVSRAAILEHVWDLATSPFTNTIETHIRNIRKKIQLNGDGKNIIRTVSGRGYKMVLKDDSSIVCSG